LPGPGGGEEDRDPGDEGRLGAVGGGGDSRLGAVGGGKRSSGFVSTCVVDGASAAVKDSAESSGDNGDDGISRNLSAASSSRVKFNRVASGAAAADDDDTGTAILARLTGHNS
jgi:hypothetical protein